MSRPVKLPTAAQWDRISSISARQLVDARVEAKR